MNSSSIRRPLLAMALIAALLATIAGCGTAATPSPTPAGSRQPTPASSNDADIPLSPVAGVVIAVQSEGLDKVHGFTLRTISGVDVNFALGKLDNPTEFPPGHLAEHQASSAPVLVWFTVEGSKLLVYHLEDAP